MFQPDILVGESPGLPLRFLGLSLSSALSRSIALSEFSYLWASGAPGAGGPGEMKEDSLQTPEAPAGSWVESCFPPPQQEQPR